MSRHEINEYIKAGHTSAALLRIGLYAVVLMAPLLVAVINQPKTDHPFIQELAKNFALIGYSALAMQFVLSARFHWIERPFGLDIVFRFHRCMGIFAVVLLFAHPILYASAGEWEMLFALDHPWEISLGKVAFLAVFVLVASAVYRKVLSLDFEVWRGIHNGLAVSVLFLGFVHGIKAGGDFEDWPMRALWATLFVVALGSYIHLKWLHPRRLRQHPYRVVRVEQETPDVWSLELAPSDGTPAMQNLPGQFGFLKLYRGKSEVEDHPFTIASAASASGHVAITIKDSGDYTATIGKTKIGDRASVCGPYGRFSYLLHPEEKDLVFVAAGVGITPMLSMLRCMRIAKEDLSVLLLYGNRQEQDIITRTELESIAQGKLPRLQVVHVLSNAEEGWAGEVGRIDEALLQRYLNPLGEKAFYVCGPPAMTSDVTSALCRLGVSERSIHVEAFSL